MTVKCPWCKSDLEVSNMAAAQEEQICRKCGKTFVRAGKMVFRYAEILNTDQSGNTKLACPGCTQHYMIQQRPQNDLIGCHLCMEIFMVPPEAAFTPKSAAAACATVKLTSQELPPLSGIATPPPAPAAPGIPVPPPQFAPQAASVPPIPQTSNLPPPPAPAAPGIPGPPMGTLPPPAMPAAPAAKSGISKTVLRLLGNLIWMVFGGLGFAVSTFLSGVFLCCTIIGIPFGIQLFKMADLWLSPFGAEVLNKPKSGCLATGFNILWLLTGGLWSAIGCCIIGLLFCCTIIGIPFGKQYFKMAQLVLMPFGKEIRRQPGSKKEIYIMAAVLIIISIISFINDLNALF